MHPSVWVVIPTYNEAANVEGIVRATVAELERLVPDAHRLLIVDDNSPDGTGQIADRLAETLPPVEVLHRAAKTGLGRAYLAGFDRALSGDAELVIEMDADFSHDPRYLEPLLTAARNADLVLGSRYVEGGGVEDWGLLRRLISRGGGLYARVILGVPIHDLTGGFKCIHRRVLEAIQLETVRAEGYVFQIEVTYRALLAGFRVTRGSHRVPRPQRRHEQDVGPHRRRSDVGGAAPAPQRTGRAGAAKAGGKCNRDRAMTGSERSDARARPEPREARAAGDS